MYLCAGKGNYNLLKTLGNQDIPQRCVNLHMLCVKGPKDILPPQSIVCWPLQMLVAAHCDGAETLYYASIFNEAQNGSTGIGSEDIETNPDIIEDAVKRLCSLIPSLEENKDKLEWDYYSAWKNDHPFGKPHFVSYFKGKYIPLLNHDFNYIN